MTKEQLKEQVEHLLKNSNEKILKKFDSLLKSGAIDIEGIDNIPIINFRIAQKIFWVLLQSETDDFLPILKEDRKDAKNMSHFI